MSSPISSPIADLSYRNYDGPINPPVKRWWPIAKMTAQQALKRKGFWAWSVISGYWYVVLMAIYYFAGSFAPPTPDGKNQLLERVVWRDDFINGFSTSQLLLFILALLIGIGSIANDNRANALLIYLSKPCTKADYLMGKWLGIFLPLFVVSLVPTILFYAYGALSFRSYGFISSDPWLLIKLIPMCGIAACLHASLALGISSLFNQGRMAGATYSGIYFIGLLFTKLMGGIYLVNSGRPHSSHNPTIANLVPNLYYCSIDGISIGLAKLLLDTDGSSPFGQNTRGVVVPRPDMLPMIGLFIFLCVGGVALAYSRIRAVEVVG